MARVLTITGTVKLPDDEFDAAEIVTKTKAGIQAAAKAMTDALDNRDEVFAFDVKIGKQRRVRKPATERKARTPRTPAPAPTVTNGSTEPPTA